MLCVGDTQGQVGKRKLDIISAYVKPELREALQQWAEEESRSLSSLMVYLLTKAVKDRQAGSDRSD